MLCLLTNCVYPLCCMVLPAVPPPTLSMPSSSIPSSPPPVLSLPQGPSQKPSSRAASASSASAAGGLRGRAPSPPPTPPLCPCRRQLHRRPPRICRRFHGQRRHHQRQCLRHRQRRHRKGFCGAPHRCGAPTCSAVAPAKGCGPATAAASTRWGSCHRPHLSLQHRSQAAVATMVASKRCALIRLT